MANTGIVAIEGIEQRILVIRGQKVILDSDLAKIYGVTTTRLNQQVRRNSGRFPDDFMFALTHEVCDSSMLHFATSKKVRGGRRKPANAFTEHGAIMAANVLRSERAVRMSVYVVRAFVKLRETLATHKELAQKLAELEQKVGQHDADIQAIVEAIRQLMQPLDESSLRPEKPKRRMGFHVDESKAPYRISRKSRSRR